MKVKQVRRLDCDVTTDELLMMSSLYYGASNVECLPQNLEHSTMFSYFAPLCVPKYKNNIEIYRLTSWQQLRWLWNPLDPQTISSTITMEPTHVLTNLATFDNAAYNVQC